MQVPTSSCSIREPCLAMLVVIRAGVPGGSQLSQEPLIQKRFQVGSGQAMFDQCGEADMQILIYVVRVMFAKIDHGWRTSHHRFVMGVRFSTSTAAISIGMRAAWENS